MATLYITEYSTLTRDKRGTILPAGQEPYVAEQTVAIGAASLASLAFNENTKFIRVHTDAICSVKISSGTPIATAANKRMAANQTEFFGVQPGHRIAVITNS